MVSTMLVRANGPCKLMIANCWPMWLAQKLLDGFDPNFRRSHGSIQVW
jgi:hypothetical protein